MDMSKIVAELLSIQGYVGDCKTQETPLTVLELTPPKGCAPQSFRPEEAARALPSRVLSPGVHHAREVDITESVELH